MPVPYISKLAKLRHIPLDVAHEKWAEAKKKAKEAGKEKKWAYVMSIFKNLMGVNESKLRFSDTLFEEDSDDTKKYDDRNKWYSDLTDMYGMHFTIHNDKHDPEGLESAVSRRPGANQLGWWDKSEQTGVIYGKSYFISKLDKMFPKS